MVQNKERNNLRRQKVAGGGFVTILIATYKKPRVLKQCVKSLKENAGMPFNLWIWDNSKNNIGLNAYSLMAKEVQTEHIVTVDEDVIRFPQNWLKKQLEAFYDTPTISFKKKSTPAHQVLPDQWKPPCWGWLGLNCIRDEFTNGALWPLFIRKTKIVDSGKHRFRVGKRIPQTCAMVHRDILDPANGFPTDPKPFFNFDGQFGYRIDGLGFPQGLLEDIQIYHACGPYYNREYEDIWKEKNDGQTIKEAAKQYLKKDPSLIGCNALL